MSLWKEENQVNVYVDFVAENMCGDRVANSASKEIRRRWNDIFKQAQNALRPTQRIYLHVVTSVSSYSKYILTCQVSIYSQDHLHGNCF